MKALKVVLVLAMVSFTMMGFSRDIDRPSDDKTVYELRMLISKPLFVNAILSQVDPGDFLNRETGKVFMAKIRVHNKVYLIAATYHEWKRFFETRHILPFKKDGSLREHKKR